MYNIIIVHLVIMIARYCPREKGVDLIESFGRSA